MFYIDSYVGSWRTMGNELFFYHSYKRYILDVSITSSILVISLSLQNNHSVIVFSIVLLP